MRQECGNGNLEDKSPGAMSIHRKSKNHANAKRRKMEDQLATIFMGYILVFLVCHSPRLMLNIYELATIREALACTRYIAFFFYKNVLYSDRSLKPNC